MTIKLSKPGKMPCQSWSLQAIDTCPGSKGSDGELVDACKGCYATDGNYRFPNVIAPRLHNQEDWKRPAWVADMVAAIHKKPYFRWFDSGDMYTVRLANKIQAVMEQTPDTKHWLPTRMHKFAKFENVLANMEHLPNVVVRKSSDSVNGQTIKGKTTSTIIPSSSAPTTATLCQAYNNDGKCGDCRACWDKSVSVIAYPAHGRKMTSIIARSNAA
jgi:hypothetical protein